MGGISDLYEAAVSAETEVDIHLQGAGWATKTDSGGKRWWRPPAGHYIDWWLPLERAVKEQAKIEAKAAAAQR